VVADTDNVDGCQPIRNGDAVDDWEASIRTVHTGFHPGARRQLGRL